MNAEVFVAFLKDLLFRLRQQGYSDQKTILFADNATSHIAMLTREHMISTEQRLLLNAPESPEHNPCERYILMTKMRLQDEIFKLR